MNASIRRGQKTPTGSGDSRRYRECWTGRQATGLSIEAARGGRIRGGWRSERPHGSEGQFGTDSKQQAGNVDLGMVVRRADSRCEGAKGRCEKPAPDRKYEQADLAALIRDRRKAVAGSQQESVPETCFAMLSAEYAGWGRSCESDHLEPFFCANPPSGPDRRPAP